MEVKIMQQTCCNCGVVFWISNSLDEDLLKTKRSFYCPNGHGQSYSGETCEEKYRKELQKLKVKHTEEFRKEQNKVDKTYLKLSEEEEKNEKLKKSIHGYKGMLGRYKKKLNDVEQKDGE